MGNPLSSGSLLCHILQCLIPSAVHTLSPLIPSLVFMQHQPFCASKNKTACCISSPDVPLRAALMGKHTWISSLIRVQQASNASEHGHSSELSFRLLAGPACPSATGEMWGDARSRALFLLELSCTNTPGSWGHSTSLVSRCNAWGWGQGSAVSPCPTGIQTQHQSCPCTKPATQ